MEMLEAVLMRAYLILYQTDFETDDDDRSILPGKSSVSECRAFTLLASVCSCWRHTLMGWSDSPTPHWVRHKLKKLIEREYFNMCQYVIIAVDDCIRYWWRYIMQRNKRKEHNVEKYIQLLTTLSLIILVYIRLAAVASYICEIPRNCLKIRTYTVQGHPRSSILVSIETHMQLHINPGP